MAAPTLVAFSKNVASTTYAVNSTVSVAASFTWSAGDVIVVMGFIESGDTVETPDLVIDAETNIVWTSNGGAGSNQNANAVGRSWTGVATGAGSGTISAVYTRGALVSTRCALQAWHFTNTAGIGNKAAAAITASDQFQNLTATANSAVVSAWCDWNALGGGATQLTLTGTPTEREDAEVAGTYDVWAGDWIGVSAGNENWGVTWRSGRVVTFGGTIEVLASATATAASDNFNRANGGLGPEWATVTGMANPQIASNAVISNTVNTAAEALYSSMRNATDQWAEVEATLGTAYSEVDVMVRVSSTEKTYYQALWSTENGGTYSIWRTVNNTSARIASTTGVGATGTRRLLLTAVGSDIVMYVNDVSVLSVNDTRIPSGKPGIGVLFTTGGTTPTADNFNAGVGLRFHKSITSSANDAEEDPLGEVFIGSSDLELGYDVSFGINWTGLLFKTLGIPAGSTIVNAYVQFEVDEVTTGSSPTIAITAHKSATPAAFNVAPGTFDISGRTPTTASVSWNSIPGWAAIGDRLSAQRTPNLASIIQELVNLNGWTQASDIVLRFDPTGSGTNVRTAKAWDFATGVGAPSLYVEYYLPKSVGYRLTMAGDQVLTMPGDSLLLMGGAPVSATAVLKVWNGSAWAAKPSKWWNGSAWVSKPIKAL
jgi:hypothetical protein